jgi:hypothetical protein
MTCWLLVFHRVETYQLHAMRATWSIRVEGILRLHMRNARRRFPPNNCEIKTSKWEQLIVMQRDRIDVLRNSNLDSSDSTARLASRTSTENIHSTYGVLLVQLPEYRLSTEGLIPTQGVKCCYTSNCPHATWLCHHVCSANFA